MRLHQLLIYIVVVSFFSSFSYGDEPKLENKNSRSTEKIVQRINATSEKLKNEYNVIISEEEAIRIAKEYRQHKEYEIVYDEKHKTAIEYLKNENFEYSYEVDWEHPNIRLEYRRIKNDGSLSTGSGKKVLVWHVWFSHLDGIDPSKDIRNIGVDIDARTGKVFTKYSLLKI